MCIILIPYRVESVPGPLVSGIYCVLLKKIWIPLLVQTERNFDKCYIYRPNEPNKHDERNEPFYTIHALTKPAYFVT
jgi:hypothetical protein